jgi:acylpyruvate hydrolase
MRYANIEVDGKLSAAEVRGEAVALLQGVAAIGAGLDLDALARAPRGAELPLSQVTLRAPVLAPGKVICLGLNFRGHVEETAREMPGYPVLFTKFADAIIGPEDEIVAPPESRAIDYEAEMAVVIGRPIRRVAPERALDAVAGFTIANDITMRDYQNLSHQWLQGKAWPRSTPIGPWLVTGDEIGDGAALEIRLELNGSELQHSNTRLLIFDVPKTISILSEFVNLMPGDLILMGTPAGVGFRRDPQVLLKPGDRVTVTIEGIGALSNTVVAEDAG